jgi:hypothetical protein
MRVISVLPLVTTTLAAAALASCTVRPVGGPAASPAAPAPSSNTLLVRLGADTLAVEQYTRTPTRMEGVIVQRTPFATIARYSVELGANGSPSHAEYSLRRADGAAVAGALQSLSVRYGTDSVTFVGHRSSGDTTRSAAMHGELVPYLNGSYALFELPIARLRASRRDSATFAIVPLNFAVRGTSPLPVRLTGADGARISWFGYPLYARFDSRGTFTTLDGSQTTVKVRVDRIAAIDLDTLASRWGARDVAAGPTGPISTRDTVRATIGRAHVWIDYGRPSLRGRDVWANGVLGDTIWRTGANAATQLDTDADLVIGGTTVPAGRYSLWTSTTRNGYRLVVNRQAGQWGTEYHGERDLARIPLRESATAAPVERFTIDLAPQGAADGVLTLAWGTKQLSVPVSAR